MELREFYKAVKTNFSIVLYLMIIAIVAMYAWSIRESQKFSASFLLNISRDQTQKSADFRYDQFYRLQADEKFSETVSRWLESPGIAREIFDKAGISTNEKSMRQLSKSFQAEKTSPQIVSVSFGTLSEDEAKKTADSVSLVISEKIESLNREAKDPDWFRADLTNLVVLKNTQNLALNLLVAAIAGIFIGILAALGKFYISQEK